jgi:hypothetical protein
MQQLTKGVKAVLDQRMLLHSFEIEQRISSFVVYDIIFATSCCVIVCFWYFYTIDNGVIARNLDLNKSFQVACGVNAEHSVSEQLAARPLSSLRLTIASSWIIILVVVLHTVIA